MNCIVIQYKENKVRNSPLGSPHGQHQLVHLKYSFFKEILPTMRAGAADKKLEKLGKVRNGKHGAGGRHECQGRATGRGQSEARKRQSRPAGPMSARKGNN